MVLMERLIRGQYYDPYAAASSRHANERCRRRNGRRSTDRPTAVEGGFKQGMDGYDLGRFGYYAASASSS